MTTAFDLSPIGSRESVPKVLVVDDEEILRKTTSLLFTVMKFAVIQAEDGLDAVEKYQAHHADIALTFMDITMPRMDGIEAAQKLRQINPNARVILCSGGYSSELSLAQAGADAFLTKPYTLQELDETIRQVMQRP